MLNKIIAFSLNQPFLIISLALFLLVFGIFIIPGIPVDVFPALSRPVVVVITESPGYAAEEVEKLVTLPIESVMNGAPGVNLVRSKSRIGVSMVFVEFGWNTNIYTDRQIVTEKLQTVQSELPPGLTPELTPVSSTFGEILILALHSKTGMTGGVQLRTLANWVVGRRLMAIPGISVVQNLGGDVKQYQVLVDPELLRNYGVTLPDVARAAASTNLDTSGGYLQTPDRQLVIRNIGRTDRLRDIANGVVAYRDNVPIDIGSVAKVTEGPKMIKVGDGVFGENGKTVPCVLLNIIRQPGVNTVALVPEIKEALSGIQASLPKDVEISEVYDQSRFINTAIHNVKKAALEGGIIVTLVVIIFLFNARTTFISLVSIPVSFCFTLLALHALGITLNTMTLGGLAVAIGMVIDDAIIDVENIFRRLHANAKEANPKPVLQVVYEASAEVRSAIFFATLIILLFFLPLFFLPGMSGRLFMPMALASVVSILASLAVSLTITPVLSYFLASAKTLRGKEPLISGALKDGYQKILGKVLRFPWPVLGSILVLFVASLFLFFVMQREFLPQFNEGSIMITIAAHPLTSVREMDRLAAMGEKILLTIPEIKSVGAKIGRAKVSEDADPVYHAELDAELQPSRRSLNAIEDEIRDKLSAIPGITFDLGQRIFENMNESLSGSSGQIVVKLFGSDLPVLADKGSEIANAMSGTGEVTDLQVEKEVQVPELRIRVRRAEASRYGLNPGDVNHLLELALNGKVVSQILEGTRAFGLFVGYDKPYRDNLQTIQNTLIDLPGGGEVPVRTLADIGYENGTNEILHDNGKRRIAISCNARGKAAGSVVSNLQKVIAQKVKLPPGYFVLYEGQYAEQQQAAHWILLLSLAALVAIFVILEGHFRLARISFLILAGIPLAIIGGVVAVFLSGGTLSVASMLGFITVAGIAARNGIMMISHYLHLMREEGEEFSLAMIVRGSRERLVPILMTALSAAFGVLPFAIAKGVIGKEILQPLCVVILGGIISSTFLNLFVTPCLFWMFGKAPTQASASPSPVR